VDPVLVEVLLLVFDVVPLLELVLLPWLSLWVSPLLVLVLVLLPLLVLLLVLVLLLELVLLELELLLLVELFSLELVLVPLRWAVVSTSTAPEKGVSLNVLSLVPACSGGVPQ